MKAWVSIKRFFESPARMLALYLVFLASLLAGMGGLVLAFLAVYHSSLPINWVGGLGIGILAFGYIDAILIWKVSRVVAACVLWRKLWNEDLQSKLFTLVILFILSLLLLGWFTPWVLYAQGINMPLKVIVLLLPLGTFLYFVLPKTIRLAVEIVWSIGNAIRETKVKSV